MKMRPDGTMRKGGLGLRIMRRLADEVTITETPGGGTTVTLKFKREETR
jgi:anti-sigma regulatory factor (Ser/Thr protein kinase)